jgi:nucleoside-diphosphate-sugar epimerase
MKTLLIVGCGDVARRALPMLQKSWRIIALVRTRDPQLSRAGVRQIVGDLDHPPSLRRLAGLADAVIHSAPPPTTAVNESDPRTRNLLSALARARVPRTLIYISTSGVYGDCAGERVTESRPLNPESSRARRRVDAENALRRFAQRTHCRVNILRAPGIYAAERLPLERLHKGLPLLHAEEDSYTNHIHADDLAATLINALRYGKANRVYNISDHSALKMGDWFDLLADAFALPRAPRVARDEAERALAPLSWSFMRESRRLDNTRMTQELKLQMRYPTVTDGLAHARRHQNNSTL